MLLVGLWEACDFIHISHLPEIVSYEDSWTGLNSLKLSGSRLWSIVHQSYFTSSVSLPLFKLCGETATRQAAAFSFGTAYQQSVSVSSLLSHGDGHIVLLIS